MSRDPSDLLRAIRSHTSQAAWTVSAIVHAAPRLVSEWPEIKSGDSDIVNDVVDLAVSEFHPSVGAPGKPEARLCGELALLSLAALQAPSPFQDSTFKACVAAVHLLVDVIGDYRSGYEFCTAAGDLAKRHDFYRLAILVVGDGGIALRRAGNATDSLEPLKEAIELSKMSADACSAARYSSELAVSLSELRRFAECRETLAEARELVKACNDEELQRQITQNLSSVALN